MPYKKEHLDALLKLIDKISGTPEGGLFIEKLKSKAYLIQDEKTNLNRVYELHDDLKRTKYFLQNIDKKNWQEGFKYYKEVVNSDLRSVLINDYKQMKIADNENNWVEYTRRIILQIENIVSYLIEKYDAHETIRQDINKFIVVNDKININLWEGKYSFFDNGSPRALKDIQITTKMNWVRLEFGIYYGFNDFKDMNFIRNKGSHRGNLEKDEEKKLEEIELNWTTKKEQYLKCFSDIVSPLKGKL